MGSAPGPGWDDVVGTLHMRCTQNWFLEAGSPVVIRLGRLGTTVCGRQCKAVEYMAHSKPFVSAVRTIDWVLDEELSHLPLS